MTDTSHTEDAVAILTAEVAKLRKPERCENCDGEGSYDLPEGFLGAEAGEHEDCFQCRGKGVKPPFWPRLITDMKWPDMDKMLNAFAITRAKCGDWVKVRPCKENKTYLGVYLGDFSTGIGARIEDETVLKLEFQMGNPAIYVPDLKRIVRGYESWWGLITDPDQLKAITNEDINNVWYVQALDELSKASQGQNQGRQPAEGEGKA